MQVAPATVHAFDIPSEWRIDGDLAMAPLAHCDDTTEPINIYSK